MTHRQAFYLSRRQVMRGLLAASALGVAKFGAGCTSVNSNATGGKGEPLTVGFIYVGPKDDYGYSQAHALGAAAIAKIPGIRVVEEANVAETNAVQETMRSMINLDGATVIFPTSFGYFDPHVLAVAKEFPKVQFFHAGGLYQEGVHPNNVGSYFGYIDEAQYIAGIVAGHATQSNKLGFVAAKPIPQVLRNINSFTLGARSVNPTVKTQVIFTGEWSEPVKEAETTNSMADQGVDVVTCHVDSPKVIMETAEKRGIYCSGYHADQASLAPKGYLTGAEWDWSSIYTQYAQELLADKTLMDDSIPHLLRGGLSSQFCKLSPYGAAVTAKAKADAEAAKQRLLSNEVAIYKGEIKDNTGKVQIQAQQEMKQQAIELEKMNWLVEGVDGKVTG
ncbi:BMP family ABC transporter substrate-binding protein [Myxacorys almedinensis]|uniref:BMP family ABC transporter substrate-binding protein n=1 Tax=Myxacorys almedinensis A TaxID=2690445 RepID=A0A8J8CK88_9CYAN|nr:BMP family ABC transporter substrate-binding protein [Myxacorys almedinensis]NDJ16400.1 BMP family ABC transporter substrate-binding protein [Myxacorys almedinensis A]